MDNINKYAEEIRREFSSPTVNMDRAADLCRTFNELYSNTNTNLVNTILHPESTLPAKYPSEWYRPTATFRLTNTFTFQPRNGKFFIRFFPNMLFTESSKMTSLDVIFDNLDGEVISLNNLTSNPDLLVKTVNIPRRGIAEGKNLSTSIILKNPAEAKTIQSSIIKNNANITTSSTGNNNMMDSIRSTFQNSYSSIGNSMIDELRNTVSAKAKDVGASIASFIKQKGKDAIESLSKSGMSESYTSALNNIVKDNSYEKMSDTQLENLVETTLGIGHSINNLIINIPDDVIETFRCNAASISIKCENNQGNLFGAITYFNSETADKMKTQTEKFTQNFSNFSQEWINKLEEKPANGIRLIKTPKDASDHAFRYPNRIDPKCEHVLLAAGTGIDNRTTIIVDVVQHIEFIPVTKMLDFFTPSIPMFNVNSREMFNKSTSSFPIIGANGGLLINSPAKMDALMNYLKQKKKTDSRYNLWNILSDGSFVNDKNLLRAMDNTLS